VKVLESSKQNQQQTVSYSTIITVFENFLISDVTRGFSQGENVAYRAHWQYCSRALG